jgi:hypothetical protein
MRTKEKKKLTIRVDARLIEQAKAFAEAHNTSVSQLVEAYFVNLSQEEPPKHAPITEELTGILPSDIDVEKIRLDYLMEKYGEYKTNSG